MTTSAPPSVTAVAMASTRMPSSIAAPATARARRANAGRRGEAGDRERDPAVSASSLRASRS